MSNAANAVSQFGTKQVTIAEGGAYFPNVVKLMNGKYSGKAYGSNFVVPGVEGVDYPTLDGGYIIYFDVDGKVVQSDVTVAGVLNITETHQMVFNSSTQLTDNEVLQLEANPNKIMQVYLNGATLVDGYSAGSMGNVFPGNEWENSVIYDISVGALNVDIGTGSRLTNQLIGLNSLLIRTDANGKSISNMPSGQIAVDTSGKNVNTGFNITGSRYTISQTISGMLQDFGSELFVNYDFSLGDDGSWIDKGIAVKTYNNDTVVITEAEAWAGISQDISYDGTYLLEIIVTEITGNWQTEGQGNYPQVTLVKGVNSFVFSGVWGNATASITSISSEGVSIEVDSWSIKELTAKTQRTEHRMITHQKNSDNLIKNGDFALGTDSWAFGTGWSVSNGKAVCADTTDAYGRINQTVLQIGTNLITFKLSDYVSGTMTIWANTPSFAAHGSFTANGSYSVEIECTEASQIVYFYSTNGSPFFGALDNITCTLIDGGEDLYYVNSKRPLTRTDSNGDFETTTDGWGASGAVTGGTLVEWSSQYSGSLRFLVNAVDNISLSQSCLETNKFYRLYIKSNIISGSWALNPGSFLNISANENVPDGEWTFDVQAASASFLIKRTQQNTEIFCEYIHIVEIDALGGNIIAYLPTLALPTGTLIANEIASIGYPDTVDTHYGDLVVYPEVRTQEEINEEYDYTQAKTYDILTDDEGNMLVDDNGDYLGTLALPERT